MEPCTLREVALRSGGSLRQGQPDRLVSRLHTDSRSVQPGDCFVALRGDHFDGHDFVRRLPGTGPVGAIVSQLPRPSPPPDFGVIEVADTLEALQTFAGDYRRRLGVRTVAVTGSSGKTSTKEMIASVLRQHFRTQATQGNLNNHVGVPFTLLALERETEVAVIEMGMNHPGEISPLATMAAPEVGVITNIGSAHIEFFKDQGGIALEKSEMLTVLPKEGAAVLNINDPWSDKMRSRTSAPVIWVGCGGEAAKADWTADGLVIGHEGISFTLRHKRESIPVKLPLFSRPMVTNALMAAAVGGYFGLPLDEIAAGLEDLELPGQRMEVRAFEGRWLINDAYNANPDSMIAALHSLKEFPSTGRKTAVLGSMGELGDRAEEFHRRVGEEAGRLAIGQLFVLGPGAHAFEEGARAAAMPAEKITVCEDIDDVAMRVPTYWNAPEDCLLVKGSRFMRLENLVVKLIGGAPAAH